jgi:branched-chain amino acid transport system permease protein
MRTRYGYYFRACRDNFRVAQAIGLNVVRYDLLALCTSAVLTAFGSPFLAMFCRVCIAGFALGPDRVIEMILSTVIGGTATVLGPVIGTILLMPIGEELSTAVATLGLSVVFYGRVVVAIMYFMPQGFVPWFSALWRRRQSKSLSQPTFP